ncbi:MAG: hypothetical protein AB1488_09960 [Nitrospirota bacterium]
MRKKLLCALLIVISLLLFGCAETLITSAIAPPTSTYNITEEEKNYTFSSNSPKVTLLLLEDKRESTKLVRSVTGFQGLLYHATGWSIDTERPINELVTKKLRYYLEKNGIMISSNEKTETFMYAVGGEIITFNLDKHGGLSGSWVANVDLNIFIKDTIKNKTIEYYRVTGTAERTNWKGTNSGIDALNEALDIAINKIDIEKIRNILSMNK